MYEGLPIATNKLPAKERKGIPHHLFNCIPITDAPWTVENFREQALKTIEDVRARQKLPILVGGTHYYLQSLVFDNGVLGNTHGYLPIDDQEKKWPILRASGEEMLEELRKVDPVMANRWHPNDKRHIRRSLEIWFTTGKRASEIYNEQAKRAPKNSSSSPIVASKPPAAGEPLSAAHFDPLFLWIHSAPEALKARLDERVQKMVKDGLLTEVAAMRAVVQAAASTGQALPEDRGIWVSIGYKELLPYVVATQDEKNILNPKHSEKLRLGAIEATQAHTRQYAKYQVRWIQLKFLHELRQQGGEGNMFLLDGTDLERWHETVEATAIDLTSRFLQGESLPDPTQLSTAAAEMLAKVYNDKDQSAIHCDACDKTLMGKKQWTDHTITRRHKAALRAQLKRTPSVPNPKEG